MKHYYIKRNGVIENTIVLNDVSDIPLEPGQVLEEVIIEIPQEDVQQDLVTFPITRL